MSELETFDHDPIPGGAADMREAELEAACETHGRELVRQVFDSLEERIVQYHTSVRLELAKVETKLKHPDGYSDAGLRALEREGFRLRDQLTGIEMLGQHIGHVSETEWHGAHRRRLANLGGSL